MLFLKKIKRALNGYLHFILLTSLNNMYQQIFIIDKHYYYVYFGRTGKKTQQNLDA